MNREQLNRFSPSMMQRSLIAGVGASGVFVVAYTVLVMPPPAALYATALALLTFAGLSLAVPRAKTLAEQLSEREQLSGGDVNKLTRFVDENRAQVEKMVALRDQLDDRTHPVVDEIIDWANRIIDGVIEDPTDIARSTRFEVYLQSAVEVTEKVVDLRNSDRAKASSGVEEVLEKSHVVLCDIRDVFRKQYEHNLQNDILDIDVDLDVLSKTLKREGL